MNITESTRVSVYTALCCAFVSVKAVTLCCSVNAQQLGHHLVFFTAVTLCFCIFVLQLPCVFIYVHCSYIVFLCLVSISILVPSEYNIVKH